jgi:DNA-binding CsgD family transcriptional regulator
MGGVRRSKSKALIPTNIRLFFKTRSITTCVIKKKYYFVIFLFFYLFFCHFFLDILNIYIHTCYQGIKMRRIFQRTQRSGWLQPRHREIMRRKLIGQSNKQIAEELGLSQSRVSIIVSSPLFKLELERMMQQADDQVFDAMSKLRELQPGAVSVLHESMNQHEFPHLRLKAAIQVLDRTGVNSPKQIQLQHSGQTFEQRLLDVRMRYQTDDIDLDEDFDQRHQRLITIMGQNELIEDDRN